MRKEAVWPWAWRRIDRTEHGAEVAHETGDRHLAAQNEHHVPRADPEDEEHGADAFDPGRPRQLRRLGGGTNPPSICTLSF